MKPKTPGSTLIVKINGKKANSSVHPVADDPSLEEVKSEPDDDVEMEHDKSEEISPELLARYNAAMADAEKTIIKLEEPSPTKELNKDPLTTIEENNNIIVPSENGKADHVSSDKVKSAIKRKITESAMNLQVPGNNPSLINITPVDENDNRVPGKKLRFDDDVKDENDESSQSDCEISVGLVGTYGEMDGKGVSCPECGFLSPNKGELHKHMRKHTPDKPYGCPVEGCTFRTRYPGNIKHHLPSHKDERPFGCDKCDLKFKTKSQLSTHSLVHNTVKPFACEICGFRCKRRWELKMHKLSHSDERFFKCDVCGHATKTQSDLMKHKAKHTERRDFKCDHCEKAYKDNRALRKHIRYTHTTNEPVNCHLCHKEFRNKINLRNHLRLHDGHYPFKCDVCEMRFANNHNKRVHMEVHQGDRPFRCPVCPYAGKQELDVRAHIGVMHHDDKIYRCGACDIGFSKERGLIQHFNTEKHKRCVEQRSQVVRQAGMEAVAIKQEVSLPDQGATISLLSNGHVVLSQVKEEPFDSDSDEGQLCISAEDSDESSPEKSSSFSTEPDGALVQVSASSTSASSVQLESSLPYVKPGSVCSLQSITPTSTPSAQTTSKPSSSTSSPNATTISTSQSSKTSSKSSTGSFLDNLLPAMEAAIKSGTTTKPTILLNTSAIKPPTKSKVTPSPVPSNSIPRPIKAPTPIAIAPITTTSSLQSINAGPITVVLNQTPAGLVVATQPTLGTIFVQKDSAVMSNGTSVPVIDIKPDPDAEEINNNSRDQNSNVVTKTTKPMPPSSSSPGATIVIKPNTEMDKS